MLKLSVVVLLASTLPAQVVYPKDSATREGDRFTVYPFAPKEMRIQQIAAEAKGVRGVYKALRFRRDGQTVMPGKPRKVGLVLHAGSGSFDSFGSTFDNNWSKPPARVVGGKQVSLPDWTKKPPNAPAKFDAVIPWDRAHVHDGQEAFVWEMQVLTNTAPGSYPMDFGGWGERFTKGRYRILQRGCRTNSSGNSALGYTHESFFRTSGAKSELYFTTFRAPIGARVVTMLATRDAGMKIPGLCADLRASPEALLDGGRANNLGFVPTRYFGVGAWRSSYANRVLYTQAVSLDATQRGLPLALSNAREIRLPRRSPEEATVKRCYAFGAYDRQGGGPYPGGAVIRLDT